MYDNHLQWTKLLIPRVYEISLTKEDGTMQLYTAITRWKLKTRVEEFGLERVKKKVIVIFSALLIKNMCWKVNL